MFSKIKYQKLSIKLMQVSSTKVNNAKGSPEKNE